jgi:hypothetical protein
MLISRKTHQFIQDIRQTLSAGTAGKLGDTMSYQVVDMGSDQCADAACGKKDRQFLNDRKGLFARISAVAMAQRNNHPRLAQKL